MGEPESLGAIGLAAREELDNLTFVINCNLQQLDGPVRGNGKIIQELESTFRGAGWNVIKVVWGREWDDLLARDVDGALVNQMNATPDGQFQTYSVETGAYIREKLLRRRPAAAQDGREPQPTRTSSGCRAVATTTARSTPRSRPRPSTSGQPTVILAKTIKGWTIDALEGRNATHQMKKLTKHDLKKFRDRLYLPITDEEIDNSEVAPFYHPGQDSPEIQYMLERRRQLGGSLPERRVDPTPVKLPGDEMYAELKQGSGKQAIATTMAFVRLLRDLMKDPEIGHRIVPIAPDEYRTFGMDSMFPTAKIYSPHGQQYESVDRKMLLTYKESPQGQMLHEGISEAGAMALDDRGRHGVRHPRRADDPGLHLLLDVRVPADRRLDLGVRRPARPRLPDRRDGRAHHADRRGPAARRRSLAPDRGDQPGVRSTTTRRSPTRSATSCRTACSGCTARPTSTRTARTSSTTSPSTTSRT